MSPTRQYHHLKLVLPREVTRGLDAVLDYSVGYWQRRWIKTHHLHRAAKRIARRSKKQTLLTDTQLKDALEHQRCHFRKTQTPSPKDFLQALALVGVATERTLGFHPYPVQYMGALALLTGNLAEMATGEGKTLTVALAATIQGWTGKPVHLLTANDYLAQRDAATMLPLYEYCRVSVGSVVAQMEPSERQATYARDIAYTTSKELLADFLRDRLTTPGINHPARILARDLFQPANHTPTPRVLRGIHTALVDEADSVLIDEATTPLIISQKYKNEAFTECCRIAHQLTQHLHAGEHYTIHYKHREIKMTHQGRAQVEHLARSLPPMWRSAERSEELVNIALVARELYIRNKDYVIVDDKVVIVDPSTGRQKVDSTWRGGIHQAIEIKENLPITDATKTLASLTFQSFFRMFRHLGATTGTASSAANELWHVYRLPVIKIPTHRRCQRKYYRTEYLPTLEAKWKRVTALVQTLQHQGRPVLIGTGSVDASQQLAQHFKQAGLSFQLLNAIEHASEAKIVAQAGHDQSITIATNMAGRGTDIKLNPGIAEAGGLHVIATDLMQSKRVDRQLYGRAARQGDPGSAQTLVSMEDELLRQAYPHPLLDQCARALRLHTPGSRLVAHYLANTAQARLEHKNKRQRHAMMQADKWLKESLAFSGNQQF